MTKFHILIPARLASTRLPTRALADAGGLPQVVRVWETALRAEAVSVSAGTDHPRIGAAGVAAGGDILMTSEDQRSGTDS